jgi:hypothetical protein
MLGKSARPEDEARAAFAAWFSNEMASRNWTQNHAAYVLGVTPTCIRRWLEGSTRPGRAEEMILMAYVFELPLTDVCAIICGGHETAVELKRSAKERADRPWKPYAATAARMSDIMKKRHAARREALGNG